MLEAFTRKIDDRGGLSLDSRLTRGIAALILAVVVFVVS